MKYSYKKINVPFKKMKRKISSFKGKKFEYIVNYTSIKFDKCDYLINKLINSILADLNFRFGNKFNIIKHEIFCNKSKTMRKPIFRAKGRINILKKRYSNLFIYIIFSLNG